MHKLVKNHI